MRYALYFAPAADDPLNRTAAEWLGRDAFTRTEFPKAADGGLSSDELDALTADPRRYGFHATLKAPFHLADGRSEAELLDAMNAFTAKTSAFDIPSLSMLALPDTPVRLRSPAMQENPRRRVVRFRPKQRYHTASEVSTGPKHRGFSLFV